MECIKWTKRQCKKEKKKRLILEQLLVEAEQRGGKGVFGLENRLDALEGQDLGPVYTC